MRLCKDWNQFRLRWANALLRLVEKAGPECPPPLHVLEGLSEASKATGKWEELEARMGRLEVQVKGLQSESSMRKIGRA